MNLDDLPLPHGVSARRQYKAAMVAGALPRVVASFGGYAHPGIAAVLAMQRVIAQFVIPSPALSYAGMRRDAGEGAHGISEGQIDVLLQMQTRTGMRHSVYVPVLVRQGQLLNPSVMFDQGQTRLLCQPVIDDILGRCAYPQNVPRRQMFQPPGASNVLYGVQ